MRILIVIILMLLTALAHGQTHTFPGNNVFPSTSTTDFNAGATVDFTGATVTGLPAGGTDTKWDTSTGLTGSGTQAQGRTALGLVIGANVQAWDTDLDGWALKTPYAGSLVITTGKTLTVNNSMTLSASSDAGTLNIAAGGTLGTAAFTAASAYEVPLTFSTGLTRTTNTVTVNTTQNITKLSGLTTNGFVKTGSSDGSLSVDTATYQPSDTDLTTWAGITPVAAVGTWIATPSSANLRLAITDENGTGALLFNGATTPDFTTGITIGGAAVSRKILVGDGTKFGPSTETWPVPGTAGNIPVSDGTNWTSVARPARYINASAAGGSFSTTNQAIPGSVITIPSAGGWVVGGQYHCVFDMSKTAGTGGIVLNVHMGTLGTTSDAIVSAVTLAAGTSVADTGVFNLYVTFKSVGSGTSAVVVEFVNLNKLLTSTGLTNTPAINFMSFATSAGFASTTQTKISLGFNGGTAFAGTNTFAQTEYEQ